MPHISGGRELTPHKAVPLAARCAIVAVRMRAPDGLPWARGELESILTHVHRGILGTAARGDVMANLWFVRAAHEFAAAIATATAFTPEEKRAHLEFAGKSLLPICKRIIQDFISEKGMDGVWMDDSGVLAGLVRKGRQNAALKAPLRLNALWYSALEVTGMALRGLTPLGVGAGYGTTGVKDHSGDHFERLAGRFRRAFTKAYWCEDHLRVCPPAMRDDATGEHGTLPDAEQLLLMILPESPIPRTKQLGILAQIETQASGPLGVWLFDEKEKRIESPLHRAWLAQARAVDAATESQIHLAKSAARPLTALRDVARSLGIHAFYRDGKPLGKTPDPLVTAEVLGTLDQLLGP